MSLVLSPATIAAIQSGTWTVGVSNFPATQAVTQSGAWSVGITGSVAVTGTFWQATQPVSAAALPLPTGAATEATLASLNAKITNPLPVSGTVTVDTSLLATAAKQDTGNASLASIDGKLTNPLPISGTVTATGPLTDTQLRAVPVPVSGTVTANTGLSQPLTDTQLRATPVPVSGTVTVDTSLLATAAKQDAGNASLASIAAEDFATEATLAELTVAQGAASSDVTGPMIQALVSDLAESYLDNTIRPISLTNEGRLRVSMVPAPLDISFFDVENTPPLVGNPPFIASPWASSLW